MRAVLYVRVSKGDGQEPETQLRALREWASSRGWKVVEELVDRVTGDPVRRGRTPPGLVSTLELIHRRRAEVLVIFAADRLVRSPRELLDLVAEVQRAGGRVASYEDGADLDTTTDSGELLLFMKGWFARLEFRLRRARTVAGLARVKAEGQRLGRPPAPAVDLERVAQLRAAGKSDREIARELGIPRTRIWRGTKTLPANEPTGRREEEPPKSGT